MDGRQLRFIDVKKAQTPAPGKRFSSFLVRFLVLFEGVSLALVVGLLYGILSQSLEREFESRLRVEQSEVSMVLQDRFNRLETRLRELSLNNTVRVSLMLGVQGQLEEVLKSRFSPGEGAFFVVQEAETSAFISNPPVFQQSLLDYLEKAHPTLGMMSARFLDLGGSPCSIFSLPIRKKEEILGYAHVVYDVTHDNALWFRLRGKSYRKIFFWQDKGPVDLQDGQRLPREDWPSFRDLNSAVAEGTLRFRDSRFLRISGFPGLFFAASSAPLVKKKHQLILILFGLCAVVFLGTILVGVVIGRKVNQPLETLADQALEVARKPSSMFLRKEEGRYLEFQKLADAFNQVLVTLLDAQEELRKKARLDLNAIEDRYRKTFESSPYSITITRADNGRFIQVNEAFERLSGYSANEAVGKTVHELGLVPEPAQRGRFIEILKDHGEVNDFEIQYRARDGRIRDTMFSARPLVHDGQECLVSVVVDITERKRAEVEKERLEQQLRHSQKMEAVGTLAGGIAHDFNNLLQAVQGYADLLLIKKGEEDSGWAELTEIARAARRASELTQQLLTFSRKVESRMRPLDLNHEIVQIHKLLERTIPKMIEIELDLDDALQTIYADAAQIEQAVMNLGLNARDAMPGGGTLWISTTNVSLSRGETRIHAELEPGDYVRLSVMDTGCGMDEETRHHIFEPFYTTKEIGEGTGLGLAMVYGIAKNHGGAVRCESGRKKGTTFELYFPVMKNPVECDEIADRKDSVIGGNETILVVDDERAIRDLAIRVLSHYGYRVTAVANGEEALRPYRESSGRFDLVILDLIMPGMGGARCLEELLQFDPHARILISSGYTRNGDAPTDLKARAKGFLPKPYDASSMLLEVRRVLDGEGCRENS